MNPSELKIRLVYTSAAVIALLALALQLRPLLTQEQLRWPSLAIAGAALWIAAGEALGLRKVAASAPLRLLVSVVAGSACLLVLGRGGAG